MMNKLMVCVCIRVQGPLVAVPVWLTIMNGQVWMEGGREGVGGWGAAGACRHLYRTVCICVCVCDP